ncbi:MAG: hypothetical protein ACD_44C00270G0003 [uncultured bacterium]|nr:MAG: hypothetical protein ACD_44C00270G0003 [uncultured bacterium]OGT15413.1 MAG: hypothetical protein A3B69_01895 [Gammaproteobacteria bacterium RIFCSPHIGHO2_02_FULL_38_33]OGT67886.1 MAG: hypothetical protein A3I12_07000 [Gammaproteobacteria bacterium RIFCSPLOWO2_02_FULL_38_11]OGT77571.1 MAG: hypothetical protein A3G71_05720 [Gammaproteobacteria bacterium RIFCSPLOWO2_12_FULL_38_14]
MQQVPRYLLIGNGRLAFHFRHYFSLLNLNYQTWSRHESHEKLLSQLDFASHVLLLISDDAINDFYKKSLKNHNKIFVHFSGSLITDKIYGAHPLFSFTKNLCEFETYQSIPFIIDDDAPTIQEILPSLPNPHMRLPKSLKGKYHALCVLAGNFSCMLWKKLFYEFQNTFNFPPHLAHPYLKQIFLNIKNDPENCLTGPFLRRDITTIQNNIEALNNDIFQEIYTSFWNCYQKPEGLK